MAQIRKLSFLLCWLCLSCKFRADIQRSYQPLPAAHMLPHPEQVKAACDFIRTTTEFDALVVARGDSLVASWGEVDLPIMTHSARKSIMSVLYGIAMERGNLRLDQTLAELGIDDRKAPLTAVEKTCTIRDLLMSRSGIYIEAPGETQEMKDGRPRRGQHKPGEYFYYNNWGFNVLGTIFEQQTGLSIGEALEEWLARPLGMKTFRARHVEYKSQDFTEHRQYIIYMTAMDLARIGIMMADGGRWRGKQIVSEAWVTESTTPYSKDPGGNEPCDAYAYLWWNDTKMNTYWASGWGGQFMLVDPKKRLVLVTRNDTGRSLLEQGLFQWRGKQGRRSHHQQVYAMMCNALNLNTIP